MGIETWSVVAEGRLQGKDEREDEEENLESDATRTRTGNGEETGGTEFVSRRGEASGGAKQQSLVP